MKTDESIRLKKRDDLELLALEVSELKGVMRDVSQQMSRIERRVKAALPSPVNSERQRPRGPLDSRRARVVIDRLTERARNGERIEDELRNMTLKNGLAVLARALGMTNSKLPPKDDLVRRLSTRIRQRAAIAIDLR